MPITAPDATPPKRGGLVQYLPVVVAKATPLASGDPQGRPLTLFAEFTDPDKRWLTTGVLLHTLNNLLWEIKTGVNVLFYILRQPGIFTDVALACLPPAPPQAGAGRAMAQGAQQLRVPAGFRGQKSYIRSEIERSQYQIVEKGQALIPAGHGVSKRAGYIIWGYEDCWFMVTDMKRRDRLGDETDIGSIAQARAIIEAWKENQDLLVQKRSRIKQIIRAVQASGRPLKVMFVCSANCQRSAMLHMIFEDMVKRAGLDGKIKVLSAGTEVQKMIDAGSVIYPEVLAAVKEFLLSQGITSAIVNKFQPSGFGFQWERADEADLLFVARRHHWIEVLQHRDVSSKIFLMHDLLPPGHPQAGMDFHEENVSYRVEQILSLGIVPFLKPFYSAAAPAMLPKYHRGLKGAIAQDAREQALGIQGPGEMKHTLAYSDRAAEREEKARWRLWWPWSDAKFINAHQGGVWDVSLGDARRFTEADRANFQKLALATARARAAAGYGYHFTLNANVHKLFRWKLKIFGKLELRLPDKMVYPLALVMTRREMRRLGIQAAIRAHQDFNRAVFWRMKSRNPFLKDLFAEGIPTVPAMAGDGVKSRVSGAFTPVETNARRSIKQMVEGEQAKQTSDEPTMELFYHWFVMGAPGQGLKHHVDNPIRIPIKLFSPWIIKHVGRQAYEGLVTRIQWIKEDRIVNTHGTKRLFEELPSIFNQTSDTMIMDKYMNGLKPAMGSVYFFRVNFDSDQDEEALLMKAKAQVHQGIDFTFAGGAFTHHGLYPAFRFRIDEADVRPDELWYGLHAHRTDLRIFHQQLEALILSEPFFVCRMLKTGFTSPGFKYDVPIFMVSTSSHPSGLGYNGGSAEFIVPNVKNPGHFWAIQRDHLNCWFEQLNRGSGEVSRDFRGASALSETAGRVERPVMADLDKAPSLGGGTGERPLTQKITERERYIKLFDLFRRSSDQKPGIIVRLKQIIEASFDLEELKREGHLLDVGTSDGLVTKTLMPYFSRGVALDIDQDAVARLKEQGVPGLDVVVAYIQNYSPGAERFDLILVSHMLYYLDEQERNRQVERMASWLKPGGKLILIHGANIQEQKRDKARMMRALGSDDTDVDSRKIEIYLKERGHTVASEVLESNAVANSEDMVNILKFLLHNPWEELQPRTAEIEKYVRENLWDESLSTYRLRIPQDVLVIVGQAPSREPIAPAMPAPSGRDGNAASKTGSVLGALPVYYDRLLCAMKEGEKAVQAFFEEAAAWENEQLLKITDNRAPPAGGGRFDRGSLR